MAKKPHKSMQSTSKKYALLSVFDKKGIVEFAKTLSTLGYSLISTGGTAKTLQDQGISVIPIQEITGNPESFDGRMKTISFQIESGILYDRSNEKHISEARTLNIKAIDIVVCNLYPFEKTVSNLSVKLDDAIENIDVGGPTMIRAAAKNFKHVLVVTDPHDYEKVLSDIENNALTEKYRQTLAAKAFGHLSFYDAQIARYFSEELFPSEVSLAGRKKLDLRYGENAHQKGAVYVTPNAHSPFENLEQLWGRGLSLTNITDINAGLESTRVFREPAAVVIKHNSPCGIALGTTISQALECAIEADPESAFGGVIVLNKPLDIKSAEEIAKFKDEKRGNMDIVAAPFIEPKALELLKSVRKSMGIYTFGEIPTQSYKNQNIKWIDGGFILQTPDINLESGFKEWTVATKKKPTKHQIEQAHIAWKFLTRIKSNAIIVVDPNLPMTRGIGTGQTSRVRSVKIALDQAGSYTKGAIMASDSFFPFDDSVKAAIKAGISVIIQQGGSINDKASIDAANAAGIPMVMTGRRAFWH